MTGIFWGETTNLEVCWSIPTSFAETWLGFVGRVFCGPYLGTLSQGKNGRNLMNHWTIGWTKPVDHGDFFRGPSMDHPWWTCFFRSSQNAEVVTMGMRPWWQQALAFWWLESLVSSVSASTQPTWCQNGAQARSRAIPLSSYQNPGWCVISMGYATQYVWNYHDPLWEPLSTSITR